MEKLVRCPRCQGMMYLERMVGSEVDLVCIQCGYRLPLVSEAVVAKAT